MIEADIAGDKFPFLTLTVILFCSYLMEEGTKSKKTVFVGGIGDDVDESVIYQHFATFGGSVSPNWKCSFTVLLR